MNSLRWEWYGLVLLTLGQIILVLRAPVAGLHDRLWQVWLVGSAALCLAIVTWRPDAWRRHRAWMVPLIRVATHLMPHQRSSQVGIGGLVLGRPPRRGLRGALLDALRLVTGMRLVGNVMAALLVPLPLPVAAATNAIVVLLMRNNQGVCQTQLMASPLTQQRLAHLHSLLDACCFMVLPLAPAYWMAGQPGERAAQACGAVLNFVHALCIVVPVALLAWTQPPPQSPARGASGPEPEQQQWRQLRRQQQQQQRWQPHSGWKAGLAAAGRRANSGAHSLLLSASVCKGSWVHRGVHLVVLLDGIWLAIKAFS
ncbi:hypothetical protein ABPG75_010057 [Micractinium tetrahymenae]